MTDNAVTVRALGSLGSAVDDLGKNINSQGAFLQGAMKGSANSLVKAADENTQKLVSGLLYAGDAAKEAARAATKHARNLAFATWALVAATLVLVVVTALHH